MSTPFDLVHPEPTPFTARKKGTGVNMNKREAYLAYLTEHGWMLDTEARIKVRRNGTYVEAQNPLAYVRPALDGAGVWYLHLDYSVEGSYSYRTDNTLRGITLYHSERPKVKYRMTLMRWMANAAQKRLASTTMWEVAGRDLDTTTHALRRRAERVAANPDLTVWLIEEKSHQNRVAYWTHRERLGEEGVNTLRRVREEA